ncbi:MAG: homoserine kinase [Nitriliruptoraceae bacterium]|nr:homoserine kinase [Nitriliruptoraceae bacterium]
MSDTPRHHSVQVPATSANLGAGFDAFGIAVGRHLAVRTRERHPDLPRVRILDSDRDELSGGDDNLVWRAFVAFCQDVEVAVPDIGLDAASTIPLERGLGSSSAAIVAGVSLARALTATPVDATRLVRIASALEGHPDNVAPALLGGVVACLTRPDGDVLVRRRNPAVDLRPVLLIPTTRQATPAARAVLPETLDRAAIADQAARAGHVMAALTGAWPLDPVAAGDHLHEPARLATMPATAALLSEVRAAGVHAWLSGAGPTALAILRSHDEQGLARLQAIGREHEVTVEASHFELSGARTCPDDGCGLGGGDCLQCPRERVSSSASPRRSAAGRWET